LRRLFSFETKRPQTLRTSARAGTSISAHVNSKDGVITEGSGETLLEESNLLRGEFGLKLEVGHDWVRPLLVAKVEVDKFFLDARPTAFNCLSSAIHNVHPNTVSPVFHPGGGLEAESVGLRLDRGDEMYLQRRDAQPFSDDLRAIYETLVRAARASGQWPVKAPEFASEGNPLRRTQKRENGVERPT